MRTNALGQPIGEAVAGWRPPPRPPRTPMQGQWCRVEPLDEAAHAHDLFASMSLDREGRNWTYLAYEPFASEQDFQVWLHGVSASEDPMFHAIVDAVSGKAAGVASYMRMDPANGCIEVGNIHYSPLLQRTPAATEAMYLMMQRVFALGYRRYEWKCDSLNAPSRAAACRLGFSYEGIFRHALVYKGRNRDTAWFAMIDREWPDLDAAYRRWLASENFDAQGRQCEPLSALTASALATRG